MSLLQITAHIKHLMRTGNIVELEKCLCRLKNRLGDLVKPEEDLLAIAKKTLWLGIYGLKEIQ